MIIIIVQKMYMKYKRLSGIPKSLNQNLIIHQMIHLTNKVTGIFNKIKN